MKNIQKIGLATLFSTVVAFGHGSVTPQAIDLATVEKAGVKLLGAELLDENPYKTTDDKVIEFGKVQYAENCARCHGLEAVSGGIAPDLRYLEDGMDGDEWFTDRFMNGAVRNGNVYMPPFEGILPQEAMWAIRTYIQALPKEN
jgi:cytochrome c-550 PedF